MKKNTFYLLLFLFQLLSVNCWSQIEKDTIPKQLSSKELVRFGVKNNTPPSIYLDGVLLKDSDMLSKDIATSFSEWSENDRTGNYKYSICYYYFGAQLENGLFFSFSRKNIRRVSGKVLKQYLKGNRGRVLIKKVGFPFSDPLIEMSPNEELTNFDNDDIYMVRNFRLIKWDTGKEDIFTLFIIHLNR